MEQLGQCRANRAPQLPAGKGRYVRLRKWPDGDLSQDTQAVQLRNRSVESGVSLRLSGAVRPDNQEASACPPPHHVAQKIEAGRVRPLEIIEHEQERGWLRDGDQERTHGFVQTESSLLGGQGWSGR